MGKIRKISDSSATCADGPGNSSRFDRKLNLRACMSYFKSNGTEIVRIGVELTVPVAAILIACCYCFDRFDSE